MCDKSVIRVVALCCLLAVGCSEQVGQRSSSVSATGVCMEDRSGFNLNCTANDVRIATATNIRALDGTPLDSCIEGTTFSFIADFTVDLTAQERFDIGLYFATDGDPDGSGALNGTCGVNTISPFDPLTGLGSLNFVQLDGPPDTCGDINASHDPQVVTVQVDDVLCKAGAGGLLSLPNCTSWRQSGSNQTCDGIEDVFPGSPSKCNCDIGFTVGIEVRPPSAAIVKSFRALVRTVSTVTYDVVVNNTSDTQALSLATLVDSTYGDLFSNHDNVSNTTCTPAIIPVGGSFACSFNGTFAGPTETDTIVGTLDDGAGTVLNETSNTVNVAVACQAASEP